MNPAKTLPNNCSICRDPIGLYRPYYTITVHPHFAKMTKDIGLPSVFCPACFRAYENFLIEREVLTNHQKNMNDIKNV